MADSSDDITTGAHVDNGVETGGTDAEVSRAIALTQPPARGRVRIIELTFSLTLIIINLHIIHPLS